MNTKQKQGKKHLRLRMKSNDNSSMAQDLDEMKKLGKEIEEIKTERELREENLTQDPKQQEK
jgi:hypothetical protein